MVAGQGCQDGTTFQRATTVAFCRQVFKGGLYPSQIPDLALYIRDLGKGARLNTCPGGMGIVAELQPSFGLVQGEPESLGPLDKFEPRHLLSWIDPIIGCRYRLLWLIYR